MLAEISQEQIEHILNALSITMPISVTDSRGRIIFVNDAFAALARYPPEQYIGENHRFLKAGDLPDTVYIDLWKAISNGQTWHGALHNRAQDGTDHWLATVIAPVTINAKQAYYVSARKPLSDGASQTTEATKLLLEQTVTQIVTALQTLSSSSSTFPSK